MDETRARSKMTISEQALFLLDIDSSLSKRRKVENFTDLDTLVNDSLESKPTDTSQPAQEDDSKPFSVASRLSRSNYDTHAKSEALMEALKQIRASHASKPRSTIIRRA